MLKAYFDDSGSDPTREPYVLAGLVADASAWAAFAGHWRDALKRHGLSGYKSADALKQLGGFTGWSREAIDQVTQELAALVSRHALFRVLISIRHQDFNDAIRSLPAPDRTLATDTPYFWLWQRSFVETFNKLIEMDMDGPVDFMFDSQGAHEDEFLWHWPRLRAIIEARQPQLNMRMIRQQPTFGSDDDFPQLQAADLYASAARFHLQTEQSHPTLAMLSAVPEHAFAWTPELLLKSRTRLAGDGEAIVAANPDVQLKHYNPDTAKRDRKKARDARKG